MPICACLSVEIGVCKVLSRHVLETCLAAKEFWCTCVLAGVSVSVCVRVKAVGRLIRPRVRALHTHGAPPDQRSTLREKCKIASNPLALTTSQRGILGGTKFRKTRTAWRPQRTCEYACVGSGHSRQSRAHAGVHRKLGQATGPTHTHADQGSWSEKNVPPCR